MTRKLIAVLFAACAMLCARADTWTDPETGYTWTYRLNNDGAEIYGNTPAPSVSPTPTNAVIIPATLGGKSVTSIGSDAFYSCSALTSVTMPNSVTSIGFQAFYGCSALTSVTMPNSVTNIGDCAFDGTAFYNSQPDGLVVFGKVAYKMKGTCPASVTIPYGVTSIGNGAFVGCSGLTSVTIPDSVTSIGDSAFYGCSGLTSVTIPDSVMSIGGNAFYETAFYNNQPDGLVVFGKVAYMMKGTCPASMTIPYGVTSIGYGAFSGCSGLTSVTIPDSVTSIGGWAFNGCSGLTSVTIPDSVTSIGECAFNDCSELTNVTIGHGVTSLGSMAFMGCRGLTSVTIPDSVTSIGECAFLKCSGLTSVEVPDSVTYISASAFDGCGRLWTSWFRVLSNLSGTGGGGSSGGGVTDGSAVIVTNDYRYALTDHVADRTIASVTVDEDCAIDEFVLKDGKVYDCVLRIVNTAEREVSLTLPAGYEYEAFKGTTPLRIPASSRNIITITRTSDRTFLVSREELETVQ